MNLNAIQTALGGLLVAIPTLFLKFGCTQLTPDLLECTKSQLPFLTPAVAFWSSLAIGAAKYVVLPAISPGGWWANMFKQKVPVLPVGPAGTVSPVDIRPPSADPMKG